MIDPRVEEIAQSFQTAVPLDGEVVQLRRDTTDNSAAGLDPNPTGPRASVARFHPFEVYYQGAPSGPPFTSAKVRVATGTILKDETDIESIVAITDATDEFEITAGDWLYLEVEFDTAGAITSATLKKGNTWTGYPSLFTASVSGNTWIHPIAHVREPLGGAVLGEHPTMITGYHVAQKTNTHLVAVHACVGGEEGYKLMPGQGGKD